MFNKILGRNRSESSKDGQHASGDEAAHESAQDADEVTGVVEDGDVDYSSLAGKGPETSSSTSETTSNSGSSATHAQKDAKEDGDDSSRSSSETETENNSEASARNDSDTDSDGGLAQPNGPEVGNAAYRQLDKNEAEEAEINVNTLDDFCLTEAAIESATQLWESFTSSCESREAAAELLYNAIYEGIPSLQPLFTSPAIIQAQKLMESLESFLRNLPNPKELKLMAEAIGFAHLQIEVTLPRLVMFRDAILDVFVVELGDQATTVAMDSWKAMLNYMGGAILYVKARYSDRINTLLQTWQIVNDKRHKKKQGSSADGSGSDKAKGENNNGKATTNQVPTTYAEMFRFNAAVMGFGSNVWMNEVLEAFDRIVRNVANMARLQEECEVLVLRIARVKRKGNVNFAEYKSCMLASLRSLLPKDWSSAHEVAWTWLWENVERLLQKNIAKPAKWEPALAKFLKELDENSAFEIRRSFYSTFFAIAPSGQDHFKQSNTYLHFVQDKVMRMTLEMFRDPVAAVDELSAAGLRHVGYGIPPELFAPFTTANMEVMATHFKDPLALEAYNWSIALMAKIMARTIGEGSTIVMKAINVNSAKQLRKALAVAPRCERAQWGLTVTVGTQSISPLAWALKNGAFEAAQAMIKDLLTIRADRDRYYFGADELFTRHTDFIKMLCDSAPGLLSGVLSGLMWRSRVIENGGKRRVNYYIKYLLLDANGGFHPTLEWIAKYKNPKIVCHDMMVLMSDLIWFKVAMMYFLGRKIWFFFTLVLFIFSQSIMENIKREAGDVDYVRIGIACCRGFIYAFSMTQLLYSHISKAVKDLRASPRNLYRLFGPIKIPMYITSWQETAGLALLLSLLAMMFTEPIFHCLTHNEGKIFYEDCHEAELLRAKYEVISMVAMFLYFSLLIDLTVLSTKVSAYVLVSMRMLSELALFLLALLGVMLAGSCGLSAVKHDQKDFHGVHKGVLTLFEMLVGITKGESYEHYEEDAVVMIGIFIYITAASFFLLNMLIAQLTCAYESVYADMVGYARLERIEIIVATLPSVSEKRWNRFVENLKLEKPIEFGKGDIGIAGGVQVQEPANLNPTTKETVIRHGGSNSIEMPWPEEAYDETVEEERLDRLEGLIRVTMKKLLKGSGGRKRGGATGASSSMFGSSLGSAAGTGADKRGGSVAGSSLADSTYS